MLGSFDSAGLVGEVVRTSGKDSTHCYRFAANPGRVTIVADTGSHPNRFDATESLGRTSERTRSKASSPRRPPLTSTGLVEGSCCVCFSWFSGFLDRAGPRSGIVCLTRISLHVFARKVGFSKKCLKVHVGFVSKIPLTKPVGMFQAPLDTCFLNAFVWASHETA